MTWTKVLCHCGHERGDHHTDTKGRLICDHYNDCRCDGFLDKSEPQFHVGCRRYRLTPWEAGWEPIPFRKTDGPVTLFPPLRNTLIPYRSQKDQDTLTPSIRLYLPQGDLLDDITVWMKP